MVPRRVGRQKARDLFQRGAPDPARPFSRESQGRKVGGGPASFCLHGGSHGGLSCKEKLGSNAMMACHRGARGEI